MNQQNVIIKIREQEHVFYCETENQFVSMKYNKAFLLYEVETWGEDGRELLQFLSMSRIMEEKQKDSRIWEFIGVV